MNPEGHSGLPFDLLHLTPRTLILIGAVLVMFLLAWLQGHWNRRARALSSASAAAGRNGGANSPSADTRASLNATRYPRRYQASTGWKLFMGLFALGLIAGSLLGFWHLDPAHGTTSQQHANEFLAVLCLIGTAIGLYTLVYLLRHQIVLTVDAIEVHDVMTHRRLKRTDILGWRTLRNQNGPPSLVLIPRDKHARKLRLSQVFRIDAEFRDWLATIPDLDAAEIREFEAKVSADASYGATAADRLEHLKRARKVAAVFNGASLGLSFWVMIYPRPYLVAVLIVAVLPWITLGLIHWSKDLYQFFQKRNSGRPDVSIGLLIPAFVIFMRGLGDIHFLGGHQLIPWALIGGGAFVLVAAAVAESLRKALSKLVVLWFIFSAYAFGAAAESDSLFDRSSPQSYSVAVVGKHVTHGKHTNWYLRLAPWGPRTDTTDVQVPQALYDSTQSGQTVCIELYNGALSVPWFKVSQCADAR